MFLEVYCILINHTPHYFPYDKCGRCIIFSSIKTYVCTQNIHECLSSDGFTIYDISAFAFSAVHHVLDF